MLDSLHRRPRGRTLAPALSRMTGGRVPAPPPPPEPEPEEDLADSRTLDALRAFQGPGYEESVGIPARALLERIDESDAAEVRRRLVGELQEAWDGATPVNREYLTLIFGLYTGVEAIAEKTGLRADVPPYHVHAMARGPIATGGDFWLADLLAGSALRCGGTFADGARVLDFGCSSGRHLRVLQAWRPGVRWLGCDPNHGAIEWAGEHLPGIEFFVSPQEPPLDLEAGSLDMAFAVSVWSHFGPRTGTEWLEEMHRLLAPGGLLVLTSQGPGSLAHYLRRGDIRAIDAVRGAEALLATGHHYVQAFGEDGDWGVGHPEWGMAYMTLEWLAQRALPGWSVALYEQTRIDSNQDLVVLQRRASTTT